MTNDSDAVRTPSPTQPTAHPTVNPNANPTTASNPVVVRNEGPIRIITLSRPQRRNALDTQMREAIIAALADASPRAIILTGTGSCFAAGADLNELLNRSADAQRDFLSRPNIYSVIEEHPSPVLAALNGHALGAGLELAMACDVRFSVPEAKLGQPEINLALIPGGGGTQRLPRMVGRQAAAKMILTGDAILAKDTVGLVDVTDDPMDAAMRLAARIADHDPAATTAAKRALQAAWLQPMAHGLQHEIEAFVQLHSRPAAQQALQAFVDRTRK